MNPTLVIVTIVIVSIILIIGTIFFIRNSKVNRIKKRLGELDIEKNKIDSSPIIPELAKVEAYLKNEKVEIEQEKKVEESVEKNFDDTQSIPTVQLFEKVQDETNNESVKSAEEISEK